VSHGEIPKRADVGFQASPICLIRGETIESNQAPRHIVRAFIGQEISDQVAAAARNDSTPILSIFLELIALKWDQSGSESRRSS